jgi:hypothetical protein
VDSVLRLEGSPLGLALVAFGTKFFDLLMRMKTAGDIALEEIEEILSHSSSFGKWLVALKDQKTDYIPVLFDIFREILVDDGPPSYGRDTLVYRYVAKAGRIFTGAMANCVDRSNTQLEYSSVEAGTSYVVGVLVVSCRPVRYRFPLESFNRTGAIITGILSNAQSKKRRQVRNCCC